MMDLADPALRSRPADDELELALFGPGVGECIVLHLGQNWWAVVDSCLEAGEPVALRYLDALGVPAERVRCIVATHWHDDHHRGISRVVEKCTDAAFFCSSALRNDEFRTLVATARGQYDADAGVDEFHQVLNTLLARSKGTRRATIGPNFLSEGKRFLQTGDEGQLRTELWALSPSSAACTEALQAIAELLPEYKSTKRRLVATTPNQTSVAIQVKRGDRSVLLGSDLEEDGSPLTGWSGVIANHGNVGGRSTVFKVPHHGSVNGHHPGAYEMLLHDDPAAILTPYRRSKLPGDPDIARLRERSERVHVTAPTQGRKLPARSNTVERILRQTVREHRSEHARMGLIRVRLAADLPPAVEMFGAAYRVP